MTSFSSRLINVVSSPLSKVIERIFQFFSLSCPFFDSSVSLPSLGTLDGQLFTQGVAFGWAASTWELLRNAEPLPSPGGI